MDPLPRLIPLPVKTFIWLGVCADDDPLVSFIIPFIISLFSFTCFPYSFSFSFFLEISHGCRYLFWSAAPKRTSSDRVPSVPIRLSSFSFRSMNTIPSANPSNSQSNPKRFPLFQFPRPVRSIGALEDCVLSRIAL